MIPNILSIAGSDPSGGAGIQADIKAISANGGYAMAAIAALTVQNTQGVRGFQTVSPGMIRDQIAALRDDIRIDAVKIGMLGTAAIVAAAAEALRGLDAPIVLDPVMVAKGGDRLLAPEAVAALRDQLLPMAAVITPNLLEAADLLGRAPARDTAGMEDDAARLQALGPAAVLIKGGHLEHDDSPDVLVHVEGTERLDGARHPTGNTHGTGCTLSSALACHLGHGRRLAEAAARAKAYTAAAIAASGRLDVGHGHGPTHHCHPFDGTTP